MECQSGVRPGAAPASISAADISACLPESVGQGSLVTEHLREVSPLSRRGDVVRGRTHPLSDPLPIGICFLPHPHSRRPVGDALQFVLPSRGGQRAYHVHLHDEPRWFRLVPLRRWLGRSATGEWEALCTWPRTFWFKPVSIFGLSHLDGVYQQFTWVDHATGPLAPDRLGAGSRRVGSRVPADPRMRLRCPQASDLAVAGDARWGSRPMAEHRVMSEDLLDITHYRSRRCYESQCHFVPSRRTSTISSKATGPSRLAIGASILFGLGDWQ